MLLPSESSSNNPEAKGTNWYKISVIIHKSTHPNILEGINFSSTKQGRPYCLWKKPLASIIATFFLKTENQEEFYSMEKNDHALPLFCGQVHVVEIWVQHLTAEDMEWKLQVTVDLVGFLTNWFPISLIEGSAVRN